MTKPPDNIPEEIYKPVYYILKYRKPVKTYDIKKWGKWFKDTYKRRVRSTYVNGHWVSTVCIGIDHSFVDGQLHIFETMIFSKNRNGPFDDIIHGRCGTWREALRIHWDAVREVKSNYE